MTQYFTPNKRLISEITSDSPVTRVRIKKDEIVFRYSSECSEDRKDEIYDIILSLELNVDRNSPTIRIKILDTDDLNTIQFEIGNTDHQTKIIKHRGKDYV